MTSGMSMKKLAGILVVLVILGFVASSAYEGFRKLGDYGRSGRMLGELSRLRGFVADYKARRGSYPPDLSSAAPKEFDSREHKASVEVRLVSLSSAVVAAGALTAPPDDLGTWAYDPGRGFVFISCTHDNHSRGEPWWRY